MVVAFFIIRIILARNAMFESWAPWVPCLACIAFSTTTRRIVCETEIIEKGGEGRQRFWCRISWEMAVSEIEEADVEAPLLVRVQEAPPRPPSRSKFVLLLGLTLHPHHPHHPWLLVSLLGGIVLDWLCWLVLHIACGPKPCFWWRVESWVGVESPGRVEGLGRESRGNCGSFMLHLPFVSWSSFGCLFLQFQSLVSWIALRAGWYILPPKLRSPLWMVCGISVASRRRRIVLASSQNSKGSLRKSNKHNIPILSSSISRKWSKLLAKTQLPICLSIKQMDNWVFASNFG